MSEGDFLQKPCALRYRPELILNTYVFRTVLVLGHKREVFAGRERLQPSDVEAVVGLDLVVVRGVGEGQSEHALLLEVRLVDARKGADDDRETAEVTRLECSVFTRGTFAIVVVTDDNPLDALLAVVRSDLRDAAPLARHLVLDLVGLAVYDVDGANQAVL